MPPSRLVRTGIAAAAGALVLLIAAPGLCAQGLPATPPTSSGAGNSLPAPIAGSSIAEDHPNRPHHAQVTYAGDQINIRANDSSLNQILRSISRSTGLKITGGVRDERVFGNYGPASLSAVLATLLDGTGTNILFLAGNPPELVLTPRAGGPTPPSPESPTYATFDTADDSASADQAPPSAGAQASPSAVPQRTQSTQPATIAQPLNNVNGSPSNTSPTVSTLPTTDSVPLDSVPAPSTTPSSSGIVDAPNPPAPGSTTGTAPNGTLTPQQVMQQLQQLQQQKAAQQQQNQTNGSSPPQ